jgi:hypothetical protein
VRRDLAVGHAAPDEGQYLAFPVSPAWHWIIEDGTPWTSVGRYPATVTGSWIVLAAWPLVAAVVAIAAIHRRDV